MRTRRLAEQRYEAGSTVLITIVTYHRIPMFGSVLDGAVLLSDAGLIAHNHVLALEQHHAVRLHAHVIMPDHVHCAFTIIDCPLVIVPEREFGKAIPGTCSTIVRSYKSAVTKHVREACPVYRHHAIWQSGFHDRLVPPQALSAVIRYITDNPKHYR